MGVYAAAVSRDRCDKERRADWTWCQHDTLWQIHSVGNFLLFLFFFFYLKTSDNCIKRTAGGLDVVDRVSVELEHLGGFRLLLFIAAHGESVLRYLDEDIISFLPLLPDAFAPRVQVPGKEEQVIVVDLSPCWIELAQKHTSWLSTLVSRAPFRV